MNERAEILEKIGTIPPLPTASTEVIRLIHDPDVPNATLARTIEYDPSLTANVLRLANCAYFGFPRAVSTIREALLRLGTNKIFQLVVAATIGKMANLPVRGYDLSSGNLWDHLIGTAIASTKLAEAARIEAPDHTFTAALTHDVGKIVLGTFVEVNAPAIVGLALQERISFEQAEEKVLGIDHAEVGALLMERWNLPDYLVEVVRWHHQPQLSSDDPVAVNLVHVADVACMMAGVGAGIDALGYRPSNHAMSQLGLTISVLDAVIYEILNELLEVRKLLRLN